MELLTIIKCPAARGFSGAQPNPSIISARSSCVLCTPLHPLCTMCTTIAPRVLHFSAVPSRIVSVLLLKLFFMSEAAEQRKMPCQPVKQLPGLMCHSSRCLPSVYLEPLHVTSFHQHHFLCSYLTINTEGCKLFN